MCVSPPSGDDDDDNNNNNNIIGATLFSLLTEVVQALRYAYLHRKHHAAPPSPGPTKVREKLSGLWLAGPSCLVERNFVEGHIITDV